MILVCYTMYHKYALKDLSIVYNTDIKKLIFDNFYVENDILKRVKTDGHKLTINFSPQSSVYLVMKG